MKKGFTFIELLVVIAIIGILASVVLASLNSARKKAIEAKNQAQTEEIVESVVDKFSRDDNYEIQVYDKEPTDAEICGEIPDADVRSQCLKERYSDRMIQNCVERYSNY